MAEGSISKNIVLFALPVFFGQLLQQLYNIIDSIVVGKVLGSEALAAVSSSGSLIFLMVGFIQGLFLGAGVIIGKRFGAGDREGVHIAVHTAIAFGLVMGLVLTVVGISVTPVLLKLMGTPADVMPNSVAYFRTYFMGGLASVMYNTCCGIFQAMGDSRHPLYYLMTSAITNTVLDILFVGTFGFGVSGAAAATVVAQFLSAGLAFWKLTRVEGEHRVSVRNIRIDFTTLKQELGLGFPTGIQNSVIAIANVIVQSNINAFGSIAMAGCGSYFKIEGFAFLPITSFCAALTTFISQNLGAREYGRARKGARFGIMMGVVLAEIIGITFFIAAPVLIRMFSDDPEVIAFGVSQARTESLFYCLLALSHCMAGILRGAGKTTVPMFVMLACWCLIRITYITVAVRLFPVIETIFKAYPITWSLSSILFVIYYFKADWIHTFEKKPV
ncbi:MAG: MATE family efflux transporter [Lachnospiraceae bacterium]|nr:MATE family efflux transporter [Lachnospiraceae bacterium]